MIALIFPGIMIEKSTLPRDLQQEVRGQRKGFQETPRKAKQKKQKRKERKPKSNNLKNKHSNPKAYKRIHGTSKVCCNLKQNTLRFLQLKAKYNKQEQSRACWEIPTLVSEAAGSRPWEWLSWRKDVSGSSCGSTTRRPGGAYRGARGNWDPVNHRKARATLETRPWNKCVTLKSQEKFLCNRTLCLDSSVD